MVSVTVLEYAENFLGYINAEITSGIQSLGELQIPKIKRFNLDCELGSAQFMAWVQEQIAKKLQK